MFVLVRKPGEEHAGENLFEYFSAIVNGFVVNHRPVARKEVRSERKGKKYKFHPIAIEMSYAVPEGVTVSYSSPFPLK